MKKKVKQVWNKKITRITLLAILDIFCVMLAEFLTLWFRFDMKHIQADFFTTYSHYFAIDALIVVAVYAVYGLYTSIWKYASISELISIVTAVATSDLIIFAYKHAFLLPSPRSFWLIFPAIMMIFTCIIRFSYRLLREVAYNIGYNKRKSNIMIIGAGDATKLLLDEMARSENYEDSRVVCIIDDDKEKVGSRIRNIPIVGTRKQIKEFADKYLVTEIIIAIPSASKDIISKIYTECQKTGCEIKILPSIYQDMDEKDGSVTEKIRPIRYEDFLGRDEIVVNNDEITRNLTGKTILVTGGGGSIGSELCRHIFTPIWRLIPV